ncbi:hypothetical protein B0J12DRAFT_36408 [Macrophomina phaseolina]|uniref:GXWXG domain-containing protein n=1 Tax=Macrophomina phaseolina TaxID=35725 RepID=A0ABQ8GWQ9_9PEZI|nr:hypothetical protein B0J12DRAFT_36408 [Macrophomina phaseolina]
MQKIPEYNVRVSELLFNSHKPLLWSNLDLGNFHRPCNSLVLMQQCHSWQTSSKMTTSAHASVRHRAIDAAARASVLVSATVKDPIVFIQPRELYHLVDTLPPVDQKEPLGEWSSGGINTGHPTDDWLKSISWMGITFRSMDDVEPIAVAAQTRDGSGPRRRWLEEWGNGEASALLMVDALQPWAREAMKGISEQPLLQPDRIRDHCR